MIQFVVLDLEKFTPSHAGMSHIVPDSCAIGCVSILPLTTNYMTKPLIAGLNSYCLFSWLGF